MRFVVLIIYNEVTMTHQNQIKTLIQKYVSGNLAVEEEQILANWLNDSTQNKIFFQEYTRQISPDTSKKQLTTKLHQKIVKKLVERNVFVAEQEKSNLFVKHRRWIELAAVLILGILIKGTYNFVWKSTEYQLCKVEVPVGQKSKINLPDGTVVWLNSDTQIEFNGDFNKNRELSVVGGEAYFEVAKNEAKKFIVHTKAYDVVVHGTKFNVMAYDDFGYTETTLVEGVVEIKRGARSVHLKPGQQLRFQNKSFVRSKSKTQSVVAWKDNRFYCDDISFLELMRRLERWYNVDIVVKNKDVFKQKFTGRFKNEETIFQVLDALKYYMSFDYKRENLRKIIIK